VQEGQWLKQHGGLPLPVHVVVDDCVRDRQTGQNFLQGLSLEEGESTFSVDKAPFDSGEGQPGCPAFVAEELAAAIAAQLRRFPAPPGFARWHAEILDIAGLGAAGNWTTAPCALDPSAAENRWWAPITGACQVAGSFSARFLMEWGAGLPVAWGRGAEVTAALPRWNALTVWYDTVAMYAPEIQKRRAAPIAAAILRALEAGEQGTTALVGHDTNQGGMAALGLLWDANPWPAQANLPGSFLRFDRDEGSDEVTLSYAFLDDYSPNAGGALRSVPAGFSNPYVGTVSLRFLRQIVEEGTEPACRGGREAAAAAAAPTQQENIV